MSEEEVSDGAKERKRDGATRRKRRCEEEGETKKINKTQITNINCKFQ